MMDELKKNLKISVLLLFVFIIQSCATVETDMKVNKDFSGNTVSKLAIAKGLIKEEDLKIEISKLGIEKYTLKKEKDSDSNIDRYVIEINWKTEEDLKKILKFIGAGTTGLNSIENSVNNTETNSADIENNKVEATSNTEIFKKDKNIVIVDMGSSRIAKLTVKVDGEIISEENAAGTIDKNKKEITFYQGDRVNFKYKNKNGVFRIVLGMMGIAFLVILGVIVLKKNKKGKFEETLDESIEH